jgi:hypothetical protein
MNTEVEDMYYDALNDYRAFVRNFRQKDFSSLTADQALRLDTQRNRLHDRAKLLGRQLGKTEKTVFAEILAMDQDLAEYGLPEFGLITRDNLNEKRQLDILPAGECLEQKNPVEPEDFSVKKDSEGREYREVGDLQPEEVGLVFARHVERAVRLPDRSVITTRGNLMDMADRTTREAIRRAKRFAAEQGRKLLHYHVFTHEYVEDVYAVVADQVSLDSVADQIKRSRGEYGIREEDMPSEVIEADWREYQSRIDFELERRFGMLPAGVGELLYSNVWRSINDPNYRSKQSDIEKELERILKSNNFKLVDGQAVRIIRKAKERREAERDKHDESRGLIRRR